MSAPKRGQVRGAWYSHFRFVPFASPIWVLRTVRKMCTNGAHSMHSLLSFCNFTPYYPVRAKRTRTVRFGPRSFHVLAPQIWNTPVPSHLKDININHEQFKSCLMTRLFVHTRRRRLWELGLSSAIQIIIMLLLLWLLLLLVLDVTIFMVLSSWLGMHGEIFHFEIFKNFMEILKYFKTPSKGLLWKISRNL